MKARERIMEAADSLFGELGFDATSTREIAARSGVNKALIHYHFQGKEALLDSLLQRYYDQLAVTLQGALGAEGSPRDRMVRLIDTYVDFLAENRNFSRIVWREAADGKHVDKVHRHTLPIFQMGMVWAHEAFPATRSGDFAATELFVSFYGMVVTYFTYKGVIEQLTGEDPLAEEQLARRKRHLHRMLDLVLAEISEGVDA